MHSKGRATLAQRDGEKDIFKLRKRCGIEYFNGLLFCLSRNLDYEIPEKLLNERLRRTNSGSIIAMTILMGTFSTLVMGVFGYWKFNVWWLLGIVTSGLILYTVYYKISKVAIERLLAFLLLYTFLTLSSLKRFTLL